MAILEEFHHKCEKWSMDHIESHVYPRVKLKWARDMTSKVSISALKRAHSLPLCQNEVWTYQPTQCDKCEGSLQVQRPKWGSAHEVVKSIPLSTKILIGLLETYLWRLRTWFVRGGGIETDVADWWEALTLRAKKIGLTTCLIIDQGCRLQLNCVLLPAFHCHAHKEDAWMKRFQY